MNSVVAAWLRRLAVVLLAGVVSMGLLTWRAVHDGEQEMRSSDTAFDKGDLPTALRHARRAAVLYAPGAPHVRRGYARLTAIAVGAESRGDRETARTAWTAIRGAALETKHVWVAEPQQLARANQNLARLSRPTEDARGREAQRQALAVLSRDEAPSASSVIVLALGILFAAGGLGLIAVRGVTPRGQLVPRPAVAGALFALVGVGVWAAAVINP